MILKLDFKAYSNRDRNTALLLITNYITGVWFSYKLGLNNRNHDVIKFIRSRIIRNRYISIKAYQDKCKEILTSEYIKYI